MHIQQITISNFRSFRQQPEIEPFSPAVNTVVGRNGSGKSNLFDAVSFCLLAPRFANLRQEERQQLLHEGSGSAAVNAFVEIVFDNSDHRFAVEGDTVVLRRTIGLKKDEFFLQRKRANKTEVQSLLEGAGFSKSNPYFIVQQGKVQDLCTMSDAERLQLLKEVAGTTVYDEKKAESAAKMEENASSIEKITEILQDIDDRLSELQSEKDELSAYQSLDRQRRAVEYQLYDAELSKTRQQLDSLESERATQVEAVAEIHSEMKATHDNIRNTEAILKTKSQALRRHHQLGLEDDHKMIVQRYTQLDLQFRETQEKIQSYQQQVQANKGKLQAVNAEIVKTQDELSKLEPVYDAEYKTLQDWNAEAAQIVQQVQALYAKQGRGKQFSSVEERDAFLQSQIQELQAVESEKVTALNQQRDALADLRRSLESGKTDIAKATAEVKTKTASLTKLHQTIEEKKRQRLSLMDSRKQDWRALEELRLGVREARESVHKALADVRKTMPKATAMGLKALETIVEQEGLSGDQYYGMLMDNMELKDDRYQTAIEVAAQNSLFFVIVDNDHTAAKLMSRLESGKLGRVTFLPLSQLQVERVQYPESTDVRPMIDTCIKYDKKVERAMQHVFGKKLLARSPEIASDFSTKYGMDAITLDGDLCSRKGALTGGYLDSQQSRWASHRRSQLAQETLQTAESKYHEKNRKAQQVDQTISNLMQTLQNLEAKHAELTHTVTEQEDALEKLQTRLENQKKQAEKIEKMTIPALEREIAGFKADMERLQGELGTELTETLSAQDRELLKELKQRQTELQPKIEAQDDKVTKLTVDRQNLQSLLTDNLLKKRDELSMDTTEGSRRRSSVGRSSVVDEWSLELQELQRQLEDAGKAKSDVEAQIEKNREVEAVLRKELIDSKNILEKLKSQDMQNAKKLEEAQEKSERLLNKRTMCISKRETYMRKIQELGSLPPPAELEKFSGKSISELMKALESVNKKLKKYSHVNKKAFDQYVNFNEQRESLLKRKEELDLEAAKVKELVENLDRQKDEAINRTFRGVSAHFKDVFQELVPNGAGEIIMRTALDEGNETDEEEDESSDEAETSAKPKGVDPNNPDVSLYRGVGIKVRFSAVGENYMMSQLSGGQKALVAMALIFAIQRCDPAPFYLFDELDQALDSTYRSAVASMIQRQAANKDNPTQFIVSTFRPELVTVANRCYGISHQNKVSNIYLLSRKDGLDFVRDLMSEEEAVGDVHTVATSKVSRISLHSRKRKQPEEEADAEEEEQEVEDESVDAGSEVST